MKKLFKLITCFTIFTGLIFGLTGCGVKPDEPAKKFLEAVKKQDYTEANKYIKLEGSKGILKFTQKNEKELANAVFGKLEYEVISSSVNGKEAVVKAKITAPNLPTIFTTSTNQFIETMKKEIEASNGNIDETKIAERLIKNIITAIGDKNAPKVTKNVDIKMSKVGSDWKVELNDELLEALTGDMTKATKELEKIKVE